jgi:hypothetical protein
MMGIQRRIIASFLFEVYIVFQIRKNCPPYLPWHHPFGARKCKLGARRVLSAFSWLCFFFHFDGAFHPSHQRELPGGASFAKIGIVRPGSHKLLNICLDFDAIM